jgi:hypothetical protein
MIWTVLVVALALWFIFHIARPRPSFVICIRNGNATVEQGRVNPRFVNDCASIGEAAGIADGTIRGFDDAEPPRLAFSGIPPDLEQRFRNAWLAS